MSCREPNQTLQQTAVVKYLLVRRLLRILHWRRHTRHSEHRRFFRSQRLIT
jgi:maltooligosyltrehalose synthase